MHRLGGFDPRPRSPGQLAAAGAIIAVIGWILRGNGQAIFTIGVILLLIAAVTWMIKPQRRTTYWRGQEIDMTGELSWWERLYYRIYQG